MKIAILGYGVVGSGAFEVLKNYGYDVKKVLDIRPHDELGDILTSNYDDILNDKEIGVVAEAIGGLEPAHTFVVKALKAGKHVVSSNKHLICTYYEELHNLALENGVTLRFTSAVGGGIPWLYNLKRSVRCDEVSKIMGIMNGTTNFILDAMITDSREFDDVLKEAQALGYAESNPSADIDGLDTARKTAISSSLAFNTIIKEENVDVFSMRTIQKCDIEYIVGRLGKTVRYLGFGIKNSDSVSVFVEPAILSYKSPESNVCKNFNMITLFGQSVGRLSFFGQGAGKYPTGNALAQDIIDIVNGDTGLSFTPQNLTVDNSVFKRSYYIRTKAQLEGEFIDSCEKINGNNHIITKAMSVKEIHTLSAAILISDSSSFFAGFEE
ncbi:MAG: homoserine dehydrogenase [Ruminococcaceae bacterium]|nr:homoserine dehydrogenase [Oscillospiraceae bacterium]